MGASFLAQNAGKRSLTVNLKSRAGKVVFRRLVATADVVVENFRPGVMERLGSGYAELSKIKPDLIFCAISGFGQDGPLKDNPAYDQIVQGLCGFMSITGDKKTAPLRVGFPLANTIGGITAAFAVAAALFRRERSGEGEFIDVSMLESTLAAMGWAVSNWLIAGVKPEPLGNENMTASPSGTFKTGAGLLNIAANKQEQLEILCQLIGRKELATDQRFSEREDRKKRRNALKDEIESALTAKSAKEWALLLNQYGVPAGLSSDFPKTANIDREIAVVRIGFHLASGDSAPAGPPPGLGADTENILKELGIRPERHRQIERKRRRVIAVGARLGNFQ
jgi:crotonobetainyl-CoA:carnitine CoA-transferase CaiB-like acyl-CoA transferase